MTSAIQRRRGTAAEHAAFTGLAGELTVDTTDNRLVVHDGSTAGGHPAAKESELAAKAPLASPTFTGTPAAPTAAQGTDTTQLATTAFVRAEVAALADSAPAALDTLNELAAALGDDAAFATTVTNALALKAPLADPTFTGTPAGPTAAAATSTTQLATTAFVQQELASAGVGTAQSRNRLVNPAMQISQENGNTAGTTTGYYAADQWAKYHVSSAGTLTAQRVQSVTPNGSKDRFRVTITAADASLAAGEYLMVSQNIEGNEVADLMWGSASAVDIVVRFGFKGPQGTYAVAIGNSATNRSYVTLFTIGAPEDDTDTEVEVVIPGDTTGTWLKDTGIGLTLNIVLAAGSTFQTTADAWQAGNFLGTSGVSNGMGTISDVFEIFDVGVYADPESAGVAPAWVAPNAAQEELKCLRYYYKILSTGSQSAGLVGTGNSTTDIFYSALSFKVPMREAPTLQASAATTFTIAYGSTNLTGSSGPALVGATAYHTGISINHGDLTVNGAAGYASFNAASAYLAFLARM